MSETAGEPIAHVVAPVLLSGPLVEREVEAAGARILYVMVQGQKIHVIRDHDRKAITESCRHNRPVGLHRFARGWLVIPGGMPRNGAEPDRQNHQDRSSRAPAAFASARSG